MSDTKGINYRVECPCCKETFLNKSLHKHILVNHSNEIFNNKTNRKELEEACCRKESAFNDPLELNIKDKTFYYSPCCKMFYTKKINGQKHRKNKDCRDAYVKNAKELLSTISPINVDVSTHIDISGNYNTLTNNNNQTVNITNINFFDGSGNLLKTITKQSTIHTDMIARELAEYKKKCKKLKTIFGDCSDYDSDVSNVSSIYSTDSGYDSDDSTQSIKMKRFDITKELNSKIKKQLSEANIDLSRAGLGLRTKETKEQEKKIREEEEAFDKEQEERERSETIGSLRAEISSLQKEIKELQKRHNEYYNWVKDETSGITQEIFDKEYSQTSKIDKLKKVLEKTQSELSKLLR